MVEEIIAEMILAGVGTVLVMVCLSFLGGILAVKIIMGARTDDTPRGRGEEDERH